MKTELDNPFILTFTLFRERDFDVVNIIPRSWQVIALIHLADFETFKSV